MAQQNAISARKAEKMLAAGAAREGFVPVHPEYNRDVPLDTLEAAQAALEGFYGRHADVDPTLGCVRRVLLVPATARRLIPDPEGHCRILYRTVPVTKIMQIA